jgi:hypothetical protein
MAASDGKFLSDHFSRQNSCSEINSSSMMTGSEERGLGNIFQLLNQVYHLTVLVKTMNNFNFCQKYPCLK